MPLGEYPELTEKGIPITGIGNYGGPLATAGGLIFKAATRDERIRAFDKKTGKVVWEYQLPAGGFATPITISDELLERAKNIAIDDAWTVLKSTFDHRAGYYRMDKNNKIAYISKPYSYILQHTPKYENKITVPTN